ncbi:MAG: hypothetical protein KI786_10930 [Mameliella sp.]|nr:hypothetical protein [Phaeodactylibacter sp.]NRA51202.1 hypothetical protein [Phaeodactylibacter sp.]
MKKRLQCSLMIGWIICLFPLATSAQCAFAQDTIDRFDSTRLVISKPIPIGLLIPSLYETVDGPRIIEEAEIAVSFMEGDVNDINSFFLTIAAPEYDFRKIEAGKNVFLAFEDTSAVQLLNYPDRGVFSKETNMRVYQHTCIVPIDILYRLAAYDVLGIRIRYEGMKRTIMLTKEQQKALREAVKCASEAVGFAPVNP